ncbi:pyrimidine 5'-nucleotidase-domain-containing protein [Gaertneriomyces semiglobifer]|nr:pyrimidine 5'-nucleotidase-domain-containing protein [Gaertneriomyces semiglobifer]
MNETDRTTAAFMHTANDDRPLNRAGSSRQSSNGSVESFSSQDKPTLDNVLHELFTSDHSKCKYFIQDPDSVEEKLKSIISDGRKNLHIISDFDMTLSQYTHPTIPNQRNHSSHSLLAQSANVPDWFKENTQKLFKQYYPIEISTKVGYKEKVKAMIEWWSKNHEAILEIGLTKDVVASMVKEVRVAIRKGVKEVFELCKGEGEEHVPILVFSAGLGDVIEALLECENLLYSNVQVVSNRMHFHPETGEAEHFVPPLIHTFNKCQASFLHPHLHVPSNSSAYLPISNNSTGENAVSSLNVALKDSGERDNLILMGDSLGDLRMAEGLAPSTKLTVGFLNHDENLLLSQYAESYDIVIRGDGGCEIVEMVLKAM